VELIGEYCIYDVTQIKFNQLVQENANINLPTITQTVYWILAASKGWIKQTYRKTMHTQNTQSHHWKRFSPNRIKEFL